MVICVFSFRMIFFSHRINRTTKTPPMTTECTRDLRSSKSGAIDLTKDWFSVAVVISLPATLPPMLFGWISFFFGFYDTKQDTWRTRV